MTTLRPPRVLAVASGGGHWVQLLRLRRAFDGADLHYASTVRDSARHVNPAPFHWFPDANRDTKLKLALSALIVFWIVLRVRPDVVVSTGAAGGYFAIRFAQFFGGRGMFIDSIANAQNLSKAGALALGKADRTLSQWPEVAAATGAEYHKGVL